MGVFVSVVGVHIVSTCLCNTGNNRKKTNILNWNSKEKASAKDDSINLSTTDQLF